MSALWPLGGWASLVRGSGVWEYHRNSKGYLDRNHTDNNRGPLRPITDPDELLHIDSLGVIRLVAFLDTDFGIRVEHEELTADNFATLRQLDQLLATKTPTEPIGEAKL